MIKAGLEPGRYHEAVDGADAASEDNGGAVQVFGDYLAESFEGTCLIRRANTAT
jgi:hypothetical protein